MKIPSLVGFVGRARAGKDTAAEALIEAGWRPLAFAEPVRQMALALNPHIVIGLDDPGGTFRVIRFAELVEQVGWDGAKVYPEARRLVQRLGTEAAQGVLGERVWVDHAVSLLDERPTVFTDVRFPQEAEAIRHRGGTLIRIDRHGVSPVDRSHASERLLDGIPVDAVIDNTGTVEDLHRSVLMLVYGPQAPHRGCRASGAN